MISFHFFFCSYIVSILTDFRFIILGLQALIEREWIQAGHPFQTRHNKLCYSNMRTKSQQPTFLLFLDCIYQLHHQFPCSFEFTTQFLILLFEHSYFSPFGNTYIYILIENKENCKILFLLGTFLGNCESDRVKVNLFKKTVSLWSYVNRQDVLTSLLNFMYEPNKNPIWPSVAPVSLILWSELYLRWVINQSQNLKATKKIQNLIQDDRNLRSRVIKLRRQLLDLQKEYESMKIDDDDSNK